MWTAGYPPAPQTFVAGQDWKEFSFPFSSFHGNDGFDVTSIAFKAGPDPGAFAFQLDEVRLD